MPHRDWGEGLSPSKPQGRQEMEIVWSSPSLAEGKLEGVQGKSS